MANMIGNHMCFHVGKKIMISNHVCVYIGYDDDENGMNNNSQDFD